MLIRPVSVAEIERTAREGLLMPPKSTFFTPKLKTGFVLLTAARTTTRVSDCSRLPGGASLAWLTRSQPEHRSRRLEGERPWP